MNYSTNVQRIRVILPESIASREQRLAEQRAHKAFRSDKAFRTKRGGAKLDVELANLFRDFGLDYMTLNRVDAFRQVPASIGGRRVDQYNDRALKFLRENFDVEQVEDSEGRKLLQIKMLKGEDPMRVFKDIAETAGVPRKQVQAVYEALVSQIRIGLKRERRFRLPGLGIVAIKFRKAREKRKGINPFTKEKVWFKAKPASNKLRFRPAKELKKFADKLPVVAPKKKNKKEKKSKKNRNK
jgi:DNA-binding protein HU-beta